jgi:cAMP-dependent protein kinase regulator
MRSSISAEAYGKFNKKENFVPKFFNKTEDQILRIKEKITENFIFSSLNEKDLETVIYAMEEKNFKKNSYVIRQGEDGDVLYLIENGKLDCHKKFKEDENETFLKTYYPGDAFGELALLYNVPRAASIKAIEDVKLWSLDRETFNHIVKDASIKRREIYQKFLRSVEILNLIDTSEINKITDAMKTRKFKAGEYIIKINEIGEEFYILEEGEAKATKLINGCKY